MQFARRRTNTACVLLEKRKTAEDAGEGAETFEKCSSSQETNAGDLVVGSAGILSGHTLDVMRMRLAQLGWLPFKVWCQSEPGANARSSALTRTSFGADNVL